jgi:hypothetical protein
MTCKINKLVGNHQITCTNLLAQAATRRGGYYKPCAGLLQGGDVCPVIYMGRGNTVITPMAREDEDFFIVCSMRFV